MDNHIHFHRKKIANLRPGRESCALVAPSMAKKTQRRKNYCSALPIFAETSGISPGISATP
jgi:hypothetical protein